jgi:hypothetical protein
MKNRTDSQNFCVNPYANVITAQMIHIIAIHDKNHVTIWENVKNSEKAPNWADDAMYQLIIAKIIQINGTVNRIQNHFFLSAILKRT